jgi:nucleotide-binding universal stress UspA family protein
MAVRDERPRPVRIPCEGRRIIVGVDFSSASDAVMGLVLGIAATTDAAVDLVYVLDGFTEAFIRGHHALLDRVDAILEAAERALRIRKEAAAAQGARCTATTLVGAPGIELTRHAEKTGADLLVLGLSSEPGGRLGRAWSTDAALQILRAGTWHERRPLAPLFDDT